MADAAPVITLGGYPVFGSSPAPWTFREGFSPSQEVFDIHPDDAEKLASSFKPVELKYVVNGVPVIIKNLWVLNVAAGDQPQIAKVLVSDRRWMLVYSKFIRRYNIHRNVGNKRVGNNAQEILNPVVPDIQYAAYSLQDELTVKWQTIGVLSDLLSAQVKFEKDFAKTGFGYVLEKPVLDTNRKVPVENLVVDDSGSECLQRAVSLIPEAGFTVDSEGLYRVFSKVDGSDGATVKSLGPEIIGGGHVKFVSNDLQRPQAIELLVSMEVETRFDFIENADGATLVTEGPLDKRILRNVIYVPDFAVTIGGKTYVQGTPVDFDLLVAADEWTSTYLGGNRITHRFMERAAIPYLDLWGKLLLTGTRNPDQNWAGRIGALNQHWRKTFQIPKSWNDKFLTIKARRVGVISPVNATSAPSVAYCDHSFLATARSFFKNLQSNNTLEYAINVSGYPTGNQVPGLTSPAGALSLTNASIPAPAMVRIEDADQGIIHVDFGADKNHMYEAMLPGRIVRADGSAYIPTADYRNPRKGAVTFDSVVNRGQIPKLQGSWKMAVIITGVPASPNDERQLYKIRIKPEDIESMLPPACRPGLRKAKGPVWQVRIQGGQDGAKALVRWLDSRAEDIEAIFGMGSKEKPDLNGLVMNHQPQEKIEGDQAASLNNIAKAIAAALYARFVDRYMGQMTGTMTNISNIRGYISEMTQSVDTKGVGTTAIKFADTPPELNFLSLLDSSTRAILMRQVQKD